MKKPQKPKPKYRVTVIRASKVKIDLEKWPYSIPEFPADRITKNIDLA